MKKQIVFEDCDDPKEKVTFEKVGKWFMIYGEGDEGGLCVEVSEKEDLDRLIEWLMELKVNNG